MKRAWFTTGALILSLLPALSFAAKVVIEPLSERLIYPQSSAPAETISYKNSTLSSEVTGRVITVNPLVGEPVKQGDSLLKIDNTRYLLTLKQSQAAKRSLQAKIKFSQYQLKQAKRLSSQRNVSEERVLQHESELESLMAELAQQQLAIKHAESDLSHTVLKAPFSGTIIKRMISEGEWANPGSPLIQLLATNAIEVIAQLHPYDIPQLNSSRTTIFSTAKTDYPVTLRTVLPLQDNHQRTVEVRLTFQTKSAVTGSAGRLIWRDTRPHLPANLLVQRNGQLGLFVAQQGKAHFIPLPNAQEGRTILVSQLPTDTQLITTGRHALQNGDTLEKQ